MKSNQDFLNELNLIYQKYPFLKSNQNTNISGQLFKLNQFLTKNIIKEKIKKF